MKLYSPRIENFQMTQDYTKKKAFSAVICMQAETPFFPKFCGKVLKNQIFS